MKKIAAALLLSGLIMIATSATASAENYCHSQNHDRDRDNARRVVIVQHRDRDYHRNNDRYYHHAYQPMMVYAPPPLPYPYAVQYAAPPMYGYSYYPQPDYRRIDNRGLSITIVSPRENDHRRHGHR